MPNIDINKETLPSLVDENFTRPHPNCAILPGQEGFIGFYRVPLACEAAPQIGCGCRSKPILTALEGHPAVERAWLNRSGTTAAVQWSRAIAKEEALRVVSDAFAHEGTVIAVTEKEYESLLQQLSNDAIWYRAATIDALSREEAELIAARLVRRIAQKADLCPEAKAELQCAIACACREVLVSDQAVSFEWRREALRLAILDAAHASLHPQIMAQVESTLRSIDYRPLNNER